MSSAGRPSIPRASAEMLQLPLLYLYPSVTHQIISLFVGLFERSDTSMLLVAIMIELVLCHCSECS